MQEFNALDIAKEVLQIEVDALVDLRERLNGHFIEAVGLLHSCTGKVIVTGIGKSGQIARKIASSLSSTGTPAVFLHPAESSHGDLGIIGNQDVVLALSYGGESNELVDILRFIARRGISLVAITGNEQSSLAQSANIVLDASVKKEACPFNLAPTASSTAMLALGDALAIALLKKRNLKEEDFAEFHPGGSLGRRLLTQVKDVMHGLDNLPIFKADNTLKSVIATMAGPEVRGAVGIVDEKGDLIGCVTDGDIRRYLNQRETPWNDPVANFMGRNPKTIDCSEPAVKASFIMEQFSIQILFVVDRTSAHSRRPVGVITYQDLFKAKIK